ncbi:hypothetical protein EYF80_007452 [Liparis tanakae]|uniref:Uncharacterized protein n=1 Tax=Liparis tanakae TaxID=230148 RepID=A0A4Z2IX51_9TELE|nr:hypothetical protein EYF80_007452 [Liparis tanakae]
MYCTYLTHVLKKKIVKCLRPCQAQNPDSGTRQKNNSSLGNTEKKQTFKLQPLTTMSHMDGVSEGQMSISPENGHTVNVWLWRTGATGCILVKPPST